MSLPGDARLKCKGHHVADRCKHHVMQGNDAQVAEFADDHCKGCFLRIEKLRVPFVGSRLHSEFLIAGE